MTQRTAKNIHKATKLLMNENKTNFTKEIRFSSLKFTTLNFRYFTSFYFWTFKHHTSKTLHLS